MRIPNMCFIFFWFPKWAPEAPKGGADGAAPPEGEGNPAEGGCFASYFI